jgi:hypothetical protein
MAIPVHTRQTSHQSAVIVSQGPSALWPRNYQDKFGSYYETFVKNGDVRFRRSFYASPPFAWEVQVTTGGSCAAPWAYILPWRRIVLQFERAGSIEVCYSDDDGETFTTPVPGISGATKPFGAVSPFDGTELQSAWVTASGKIQALRRYAGAAAYETPFFFKDSAGVDLVFEDDTHSYFWGYEGASRLIGHFHIDGESATSTWWSGDDGETWTRFS